MAFPDLRNILANSCMVDYTVKEAKDYLNKNGYGRHKIGNLMVTLDGEEGYRVDDFDIFKELSNDMRATTTLKAAQTYEQLHQHGYEDSPALENMFSEFVMLIIAMMNCFGRRETNSQCLQFTIDNDIDVYGKTLCAGDVNIIIVNIKKHINGVHLMETLLHEVTHALLLPFDGGHGYEFYRTGAAVVTLAMSTFGTSFKSMCLYTAFDADI